MDKQPEQSTPPTTRKEFLTNSARAGARRPPARSPGSLGWVKSAASKAANLADPAVTMTWGRIHRYARSASGPAILDQALSADPSKRHHQLKRPPRASNVDRVLATEFAAGAGPDIYDQAGPSFMPQYIQNGDAANLDAYAKKYGWRQKLSSFSLQSSLYQGKLYYLPTEFESLHLWYNKTLMQKYGWKLPTNYNELLTVCAAIKDKGLIPFVTGMNGWLGCWDWWYSYFLNAYLGTRKLYKVLTGEVPWTDPAIVTSFQMMKKFVGRGLHHE